MKKIYALALLVAISFTANATKVIVTCQNSPSHFLPVTVNAVVGDTIHWTWIAGTHIVGPISTADIPAGAAMWAGPMDASHQSFEYVVTVAGSYHYVCHPQTPHGEDAYIVVTNAVGVQQQAQTNPAAAYPNPFSEKITFETPDANAVLIFNSLGEKVRSFEFKAQAKAELDLATLPKGIYLYLIMKEGAIIDSRRIIKE